MTTLKPFNTSEMLAVREARAGEGLHDVSENEFIDTYKRQGAILFRGFKPELDDFRALTTRYCSSSVFNESTGRTVLDRQHDIQTVNLGNEAFPLHPELSREPWKPDVCFFWCSGAPSRGGETTLCDGVEIVKRLPTSAYDALRDRRLLYSLPALPSVCQYWLGSANPSDDLINNPPSTCPYTFTRTPKGVWRHYSVPALHKPMFADGLAFGNFLLFSRYLTGNRNFPTFENGEIIPDELAHEIKTTSDAITLPVQWQPGDVLVLDNTRFMHGRNAILEVAERHIATFFGFLKFAKPGDEEIPNAPWRRGGFVTP